MWPKLVTAAEECAELWALYHHWVTRFNPVQWWEHPFQASLQGEPRAGSAASRCFTLASPILWAHGTGMDRAEQPAGSFPNHCGLISWSRECSCSKQTTRWLCLMTLSCAGSALDSGRRGSYSLSWEKRQSCPRRKGYKIFWTQKPRIVQQLLPSYWNRGLFCQERSA